METTFEVIARGVILKDDKILLCKLKDKDYYYFPGGHLEKGEDTVEALKRELKEELGMEIKKINFIGASENSFQQNGESKQEINLVFSAETEEQKVQALEDHLEFAWIEKEFLVKTLIFPISLKESVINWLEERKNFYTSWK